MKKLLQINSVANIGSTGRIAEEIGQIAINNGWESYIAYGRHNSSSKSKLIKIGTNLDNKIHGIQTRILDRHGLSSTSATKRLISQMQSIKPDLVHLHNIHGYYLDYRILFNYLSKTNVSVVWTLHDCWPFTGHCTYFDFVGCEKWKVGCNNCPQKKEYPASFIFDRSIQNFAEKKVVFNSVSNLTIVPVSKWLGDLVRQSFLSNHALHVINNGINTNIFKPVENHDIRVKYKLNNKFVVLGVASDWCSRKGLFDFIRLSKVIESNIKIVLVGLNKKQLKIIPKNIIGIEKTANINQLVGFYSCADIFVNPTLEDNFPTTNIEALACGTPVITYNTGGSPESIDKNTGFVIEKGNIDELVHAIKRVKKIGKLNFSNECTMRVQKLYNKDKRFMDYISLYEKLLKN